MTRLLAGFLATLLVGLIGFIERLCFFTGQLFPKHDNPHKPYRNKRLTERFCIPPEDAQLGFRTRVGMPKPESKLPRNVVLPPT